MRYMFMGATIVALSFTCGAMASSVVFNRDVVKIHSPVSIPITTVGEETDIETAESENVAETMRTHQFYVTTRNGNARDADWIIDKTDIRRDFGVMYLLDEPAAASIRPSAVEERYDIVFIGSYGTIRAIAEDISPSELVEPLTIDSLVKALLYLDAGTTRRQGIRPSDTVEHSAFPDKPLVTSE